MKITLEPTGPNEVREYPCSTVMIQHPHDDVNMEELTEMFRRAAIAWGFQPETVRVYIPEE